MNTDEILEFLEFDPAAISIENVGMDLNIGPETINKYLIKKNRMEALFYKFFGHENHHDSMIIGRYDDMTFSIDKNGKFYVWYDFSYEPYFLDKEKLPDKCEYMSIHWLSNDDYEKVEEHDKHNYFNYIVNQLKERNAYPSYWVDLNELCDHIEFFTNDGWKIYPDDYDYNYYTHLNMCNISI